MMKAQKFYKVMNMADGLWMLNDVRRPVFTEKGHVWKGIGPLRAYFTNLKKYATIEVSPLWEIVELEYKEVDRYPAAAMIKNKKN